jgi:hypothetical protein
MRLLNSLLRTVKSRHRESSICEASLSFRVDDNRSRRNISPVIDSHNLHAVDLSGAE